MKKVYFIAALSLFSLTTLQAQVYEDVEEEEIMPDMEEAIDAASEAIMDAVIEVEREIGYESYPEAQEVEYVDELIDIAHYEEEVFEAPSIGKRDTKSSKKSDDESDLLPKELLTHPYIKYQHQINEPGVAEAYPWISADALRMYFTKNNEIYTSERNGRYEEFGKPHKVDMERNNNYNNAC
jgi:hypothetical protein